MYNCNAFTRDWKAITGGETRQRLARDNKESREGPERY